VAAAASRDVTSKTPPWGKKNDVAAEGPVTTGAPHAAASRSRREHIVGDAVTELAFNWTL